MSAPSAFEQYTLELVNRFRMDPGGEYARLVGKQSNVDGAISFFNVDLSALQSALGALQAAAPLAWNNNLSVAAEGHSQAMINADLQAHQIPGGPDLSARVTAAGYTGFSTVGENIFAFTQDAFYGHAGFVIDWGNGPGGMQDPPGHRNSLISSNFTEIGIASISENNPSTSVGPEVVTQDLGNRFNYSSQLLGVVINDTNNDDFYNIGEGMAGVTVDITDGTNSYQTTTWASGGWQIDVPAGSYTVTFSGGGLTGTITKQAVLGATNVKVDAEAAEAGTVAPPQPPAGDFSRADGWLSQDSHARRLGDVNGDGFDDIVGFAPNGVTVALSNGTGGFGPATLGLAAFGRDTGGWFSNDRYPRELADVNGDGRTDIVAFGDGGVFVSLGNGTGFDAPTVVLAGYGPSAGGWISQDRFPRKLADVNGDGSDDIVAFGAAGTYVSLANGTGGFDAPILGIAQYGTVAGGWVSNDRFPRHLADVNGDGNEDIVAFGDAGVYVSLADGTGRFGAPTLAVNGFGPSAGGWFSDDRFPRMLDDVDGDGNTDIVAFGDAGVYVAFANITGGFNAPTFTLGQFGPSAGGWSSQETYPRLLGDIDGDNKADIVAFGETGVATNTSRPAPFAIDSALVESGSAPDIHYAPLAAGVTASDGASTGPRVIADDPVDFLRFSDGEGTGPRPLPAAATPPETSDGESAWLLPADDGFTFGGL